MKKLNPGEFKRNGYRSTKPDPESSDGAGGQLKMTGPLKAGWIKVCDLWAIDTSRQCERAVTFAGQMGRWRVTHTVLMRGTGMISSEISRLLIISGRKSGYSSTIRNFDEVRHSYLQLMCFERKP